MIDTWLIPLILKEEEVATIFQKYAAPRGEKGIEKILQSQSEIEIPYILASSAIGIWDYYHTHGDVKWKLFTLTLTGSSVAWFNSLSIDS